MTSLNWKISFVHDSGASEMHDLSIPGTSDGRKDFLSAAEARAIFSDLDLPFDYYPISELIVDGRLFPVSYPISLKKMRERLNWVIERGGLVMAPRTPEEIAQHAEHIERLVNIDLEDFHIDAQYALRILLRYGELAAYLKLALKVETWEKENEREFGYVRRPWWPSCPERTTILPDLLMIFGFPPSTTSDEKQALLDIVESVTSIEIDCWLLDHGRPNNLITRVKEFEFNNDEDVERFYTLASKIHASEFVSPEKMKELLNSIVETAGRIKGNDDIKIKIAEKLLSLGMRNELLPLLTEIASGKTDAAYDLRQKASAMISSIRYAE